MRPLSICSAKAMDLMGLGLFKDDVELSDDEQRRQIKVWLWLHTAPLAEICAALWDGTWRGLLDSKEAPGHAIVTEFRSWHQRVLWMLEACAVDIRPRPRSKGDDTPRDVVPPSKMAFMVSIICHHTHLERHRVKWHLFLPEALQEYHVAMRWNGQWTVRPGSEVKMEELENLAPEWLTSPDIDTSAAS